MSEARLDQIVKGAPSPNVTIPQVAADSSSPDPNTLQHIIEDKKPASHPPSADPTATLPSSPPQIYLNLLILEASLRSQYLTLRARRRQHLFFLYLLTLWTSFFGYVLFFRTREDGRGVGGSPYWLFDVASKICFMGGVLTAVLIWATGQWERGVRWPRRWLGITNRGLRGMNLKIVVIKGPWWKRLASYAALVFPYSLLFSSQGTAFHYIEYPEKRHAASSSRFVYRDGHQFKNARLEDIERGGDHIRLLLLPKPFSPEFRENWEVYRTEYWDKENERRQELRKVYKRRQKQLAKEQGGWLWWTGLASLRTKRAEKDLEKSFTRPTSQRKRRTSSIHGREQHSRSSSRSSAAVSGRRYLNAEVPSLSKRASTISNSSYGSTASEAGDSEKSALIEE